MCATFQLLRDLGETPRYKDAARCRGETSVHLVTLGCPNRFTKSTDATKLETHTYLNQSYDY